MNKPPAAMTSPYAGATLHFPPRVKRCWLDWLDGVALVAVLASMALPFLTDPEWVWRGWCAAAVFAGVVAGVKLRRGQRWEPLWMLLVSWGCAPAMIACLLYLMPMARAVAVGLYHAFR